MEYRVTRRNFAPTRHGWADAPEPYIRENCGSWRKNGVWGEDNDLVRSAIFIATHSRSLRPTVARCARDVYGWFERDTREHMRPDVMLIPRSAIQFVDVSFQVDGQVPSGTIRLYKTGLMPPVPMLLAELRGFTP